MSCTWGIIFSILFVLIIGVVVAIVRYWDDFWYGFQAGFQSPPHRSNDPMQALQDPTHPDHVRWTMEVLDSDADGVIEDWEIDALLD
jgi:hypothetical protein